MKLIDYKIAYEWAAKLVEKRFGAKNSEPKQFEKAVTLKMKAKNKFDEECEKFINKYC